MSLDAKLKAGKSQAQINQKVIDEINGLETAQITASSIQSQSFVAFGQDSSRVDVNNGNDEGIYIVSGTTQDEGAILGVNDEEIAVINYAEPHIRFGYARICCRVSGTEFTGVVIHPRGASSARPTDGIKIGATFFDTTLGKPIWVKSLSPTVWVNATGATV